MDIGEADAVVAYVTGDSSAGGGVNALYTRRSGDLGRTWSDPVRVVGSGVFGLALLRIGPRALALLWVQRPAAGARLASALWLSRSRDDGASWETAAQVPDTRGVQQFAAITLSDRSAVVAVQRGGPLRREHRLLRLTEHAATSIFRDSVDAAYGPVLVALGRDSFSMLWARGDTLPGGIREGVIPWLVVQGFVVPCLSPPK
jgi:hypothetical protein